MAGSNYGRIFETKDGGINWSEIFNSSHKVLLRGVAVSNTNTAIVAGYTPSNDSRILLRPNQLRIGTDNARRFSWFYMSKDATSYEPLILNSSLENSILEINLNNKQATSGATKFYVGGLFVDSNGIPKSVNADIGSGIQDYIGFAVQYKNVAGSLHIDRIVGIRPLTYPVSPTDTTLIHVDTLISITSLSIAIGQYSNVRFLKSQLVVQNNIYGDNGENPDYNLLITRASTLMNTTIQEFIFDNRFTPFVIGQGGAGATDGDGLIDNLSWKVI